MGKQLPRGKTLKRHFFRADAQVVQGGLTLRNLRRESKLSKILRDEGRFWRAFVVNGDEYFLLMRPSRIGGSEAKPSSRSADSPSPNWVDVD